MTRRKVFHDGKPAQIKVSLPTKLRLKLLGAQLGVKRGYELAPAEVVEMAVGELERRLASNEAPK